MHEFRWMAPIRVGFTTSPGAMERNPDEYRSFWDQVKTNLAEPGWAIHRTSQQETPLGWSKADSDTLPHSLSVVSGSIDPTSLPARFHLVPTELEWTLFDHGVLLVWGKFRTDDDVTAELHTDPDQWEQAVQSFGEELTQSCARTEFQQLISAMEKIEEHGNFIDLEESEVERPLWVTRALILNPAEPQSCALARRWVSGIDEQHRTEIEAVIDGSQPLLAQWLNHVHRADQPEAIEQSWASLKKAQFFWAAMQWIDEDLRQILAWSMADRAEVSVGDLKKKLRATVNRAQDLIMLRAEVRQHVSRTTHLQMQRFLELWEFEELLQEPVNEKVEICKERLSALAEDRAARSAMFTDIILMGIGVTSVLATAIALVQFGREASQDPSQSIFDFGSGSITSWLSSQSMDAILVLSLLLSLVLVTVFVWKRRQSIS